MACFVRRHILKIVVLSQVLSLRIWLRKRNRQQVYIYIYTVQTHLYIAQGFMGASTDKEAHALTNLWLSAILRSLFLF